MPRNSDRRKIKDVQNITGAFALEKIAALQTVTFRNIDEDQSGPVSIGFIAQDFERVFPDLIRKRKKDDGIKPIKKPKPPRVPTPPVLPGAGTGTTTPGTGTGTTTPPTGGTAPTTPTTPAPTTPAPATPGTGGQTSGAPKTLAAFFTDEPLEAAAAQSKAMGLAAAADDDDDDPSDSISTIEQQGYQITTYEDLIPVLVGAVKELGSQLQSARDTIAELEKKVKKLSPAIN